MTHTSENEMNACEHHEGDLSAILDGELVTVDLPATLDHLIDCPSCAAFYRRSRRLDRAVAASQDVPYEGDLDDLDRSGVFRIDPHESVWRRIAERAPWAEAAGKRSAPRGVKRLPESSRSRRRLEWAPRLAAVFLFAFGVWMLQVVWRDADSALFQSGEPAVAGSATMEARDMLEGMSEGMPEDMPEDMTEERFVELATEVLRADPRYQHEMLEVMKSATRSGSREATVDYRRTDEALSFSGGSRGEGDRTTDGRAWQ